MLWRKVPWFARTDAPAGRREAEVTTQPVQSLKADVLCKRLGQLMADMPPLEPPLSTEAKQWLATVYALVLASGHTIEAASLSSKMDMLSSRVPEIGAKASRRIVPILNGVLVTERLRANADQPNFFPSRPLDALAPFSKVLPTAHQDVLIIDPYLDEKSLADFARLVVENVRLRLLAGEEQLETALKPAAPRWARQNPGSRPLEVRLAPRHLVHDRLISIDGRQAWSMSKSFNSHATRSPPSILRVEPEVAALKVKAYENIWEAAETLRRS